MNNPTNISPTLGILILTAAFVFFGVWHLNGSLAVHHPKYKVGDCFFGSYDKNKVCEKWDLRCRSYANKVLEIGIASYRLEVAAIYSDPRIEPYLFELTQTFESADFGTQKFVCPKALEAY